jgi:hypothetical protein
MILIILTMYGLKNEEAPMVEKKQSLNLLIGEDFFSLQTVSRYQETTRIFETSYPKSQNTTWYNYKMRVRTSNTSDQFPC